MGIYPGLTYHLGKGLHREFHWHPEVEVLFSVEGTTRVTIKETDFTMGREDVLVVNSSVSHRVISEPDGIVCYIRFPWRLMDELIGDGSKVFACNSTVSADRYAYRELQSCFRDLVYEYVRPSRKTSCNQDILMLRILDLLVERFQLDMTPPSGGRVSDDVRIQQIVHYVNRNFHQNVSLSTLAEELFLSPSTLSRFFKKQTGIYFVDYVNQVRARFGLTELIYTNDSITEIAVNSGFSNLSVFSRVFKEIYGMTPTDYRRQHRQNAAGEDQEKERLRSELAGRLPEQRDGGDEGRQDEIVVDAKSGAPWTKAWNLGINVGFLDQLTQNNLRSQTLMLCQTLGFQYARVWNVYSRRLMLTDGVSVGGYNYGKLDEALDFLVNNHIRPWLDLGRRSFAAVVGDGSKIFSENQYIDFRSRRAWEALTADFLRHVVKRYGQEEVNRWIFELGISPGCFNPEPLYQDPDRAFDFFEAFRFFYHTVRTSAPEARVGGFGLVPGFRTPVMKRLLLRCVAGGCKPDFVSFLMFPYEEEEKGDGRIVSRRFSGRDAEQNQVDGMRQLLRETGNADCRLYACEWNCTLSNRSFLNDCCYRSAYIARTVNRIWDRVDMACIRLGSDLVGSYYDTFRVANGDDGLLTIGGVRKPAYFVFQFLHRLGDYLVQRGDGYLITRTAHGRFYILCCNYKWFNSSFFLRPEEERQPWELPSLFEDDKPLDLRLVLEGLTEHSVYFINRQTIGCGEGSLLHEWANFQYEDSTECRRYLDQACFPRMSMVKQQVRNGRLEIHEHLEAQEVSLLYLYADI